jgi:hypothetical protein
VTVAIYLFIIPFGLSGAALVGGHCLRADRRHFTLRLGILILVLAGLLLTGVAGFLICLRLLSLIGSVCLISAGVGIAHTRDRSGDAGESGPTPPGPESAPQVAPARRREA